MLSQRKFPQIHKIYVQLLLHGVSRAFSVRALPSWFAVHPVSMNNSNHLVNSDNVGYASYLFEQEKNKGMLPGEVGMAKGKDERGLGLEG